LGKLLILDNRGGAMADRERAKGRIEDPVETQTGLSLATVDEANEIFATLGSVWRRFHPSDRWTADAWRVKSGTLRMTLYRVDRQLDKLMEAPLGPGCRLDARLRYLETCGQARRAVNTVKTSLDKLESMSNPPQRRPQLRERLMGSFEQLEERLGEVIVVLLDLVDV
jgi:hypothetical protein